MNPRLQVLLVEDDPMDATLLTATLEQAGLQADVATVDSAHEFEKALMDRPDVILCDFNLPQFDAFAALELRGRASPDVPFLVVTGAVGEEVAAECIKRGATDFILKDHLHRLPREITRAVEESRVRRTLREVESEYRNLVESVPAAVYTADLAPAGQWFYVSPQMEPLLGLSPAALVEDPLLWEKHLHPDDGPRVMAAELDALETATKLDIEYRMIRPDGRVVWIHDEAVATEGSPEVFHGVVSDITERKLAEEALRSAEEHYRSLVETVQALVWRSDLKEERLSYVSSEAEQLFGYPIESWTSIPRFWEDHLHPDDREAAIERSRTAVKERTGYTSECRMIAADGRVVWVRDSVHVVVDNDEVTGLIGVMVDITEIKEAEREALIRAEQQAAVVELGQLALKGFSLSLLCGEAVQLVNSTLRTANCGVLRASDNGLIVEAAAGVGADALGAVVPLGKKSHSGYTLLVDAPVISNDVTSDPRFEWTQLPGEVPPRSGMTVIIRDEEDVYGVLAAHDADVRVFTRDDVYFLQAIANVLSSAIRRHRAQEQISIQARMLDQVGTGILRLDPSGEIRYWNEAATKMLGWENDDVEGSDLIALLVDGDGVARADRNLHALEINGQMESEWLMRSKVGPAVPVFATLTRVPLDSGASEIVAVLVDISEHKEMERRLRASEDQFRTAFMNMTAGMMICDAEGCYLAVNDAFCRLVGYEREELLGRSYREITHPDDLPDNVQAFAQVLKGGGTVDMVKRYVRKDGEIVWAEVTDIVLRDDHDGAFHALVQVLDITDRKRSEQKHQELEKQLLQAQKMEAIGRLAGGIAHDFNNLLAVVINYANFLDEDLAPDDPKRQDVAEIQKAGERATALVRQLLTFSKKEPAERSSLVINDVILDMRSLLATSLGEDVKLELNLEEDVPPVLSDPTHLEQILMNLVVNARDAMPEGGRISIGTAQRTLDENGTLAANLSPGRYVELSVEDTGEGIPPEYLAQIFEPFFSTKERDKGTGLGLATVYGLITQAGGSISVDSNPGTGTSFSILLPALVQAQEDTVSRSPGSFASDQDPISGKVVVA